MTMVANDSYGGQLLFDSSRNRITQEEEDKAGQKSMEEVIEETKAEIREAFGRDGKIEAKTIQSDRKCLTLKHSCNDRRHENAHAAVNFSEVDDAIYTVA